MSQLASIEGRGVDDEPGCDDKHAGVNEPGVVEPPGVDEPSEYQPGIYSF